MRGWSVAIRLHDATACVVWCTAVWTTSNDLPLPHVLQCCVVDQVYFFPFTTYIAVQTLYISSLYPMYCSAVEILMDVDLEDILWENVAYEGVSLSG